MHHLSRVFDKAYGDRNRSKSKKMDQQTPSPRPKLVRRNAAKNFEFTPSPSTSTSPSTSGSSSAPRTRSLDLPHDKTSFRINGMNDMDSIFESLGLSGPEDFEIPKAAWEAMKHRSASDVIVRPKKGQIDDSEIEEPQREEVPEFVETLPQRFGNDNPVNDVNEAEGGSNDLKLPGNVGPLLGCNNSGASGKGGGIKGDRPPLLAPPPAMSLPVMDNGCSTWELLEGLAPAGDGPPRFSYHGISDGEEEGDRENAHIEGSNGVRVGGTVIMSRSCSFTTNDDDSSSTTTEPVSIISPNSGCRLNISHWDKVARLGSGSFGTVYRAISSEGFFFAVKEVSLLEQGSQGKQSIYQLEQEIELLSRFEHENIVRYLGTDKDDSNLYIFLELVTQGSLASLYQKCCLRDSIVSAYTRQILLGLKYLHDKNVVHRDIKCANILVASSGTIKLADFGLAKATTRENVLKSCKGTVFWMAPEVICHENQGYGLAADIWSLGCTVLEMITRHVPYHPLEFQQAFFRIGMGEPPPIPDSISREAQDFIRKCLRVKPYDRPTASELLEHPFVERAMYTPLGSESPMMQWR